MRDVSEGGTGVADSYAVARPASSGGLAPESRTADGGDRRIRRRMKNAADSVVGGANSTE